MLEFFAFSWVAIVTFITAWIDFFLSGGGGFVTLPVLLKSGLSPISAVASMNLAFVFTCLVGIINFRNKIEWQELKKNRLLHMYIIILIGLGFLAPLWAIDQNDTLLKKIILGVLLVMISAFLLSKIFHRQGINSKTWYKKFKNHRIFMGILGLFLAVVVGIYAPLIGSGSSIFLTVLIANATGLNYKKVLPIRLIIVLLLSIPQIIIFSWKGVVNWEVVFWGAIGTTIGVYTCSHIYLKTHPKIIDTIFLLGLGLINIWVAWKFFEIL